MILPLVQTRVRVLLTVEVSPTDRWGSECSIGQVHEQGGEAGLNELRKVLAGAYGKGPGRFEIVGTPKVTAVLVEEG